MTLSANTRQMLQRLTVVRAEHGNVIARDRSDNQEFVFAECNSPAIANCILEMVNLLTGDTDVQQKNCQ